MKEKSFLIGVVMIMLSLSSYAMASHAGRGKGTKRRMSLMHVSPQRKRGIFDLLYLAHDSRRADVVDVADRYHVDGREESDAAHWLASFAESPVIPAWLCSIEPDLCRIKEECLHCCESEDDAIPMTQEQRNKIVHSILTAMDRPIEELDQETAQQLHRSLHPEYCKIADDQKAINQLYSGLKAQFAERAARRLGMSPIGQHKFRLRSNNLAHPIDLSSE